MKNTKNMFWTKENKIVQSSLIAYLENQGFGKLEISHDNFIYVRLKDSVIYKSSIQDMTQNVRGYLDGNENSEIYEVFARGVGQYLSNSKLKLLKVFSIEDKRDSYEASRFFFKDFYYEVNLEGVKQKTYDQLDSYIWSDLITNRKIDISEIKDDDCQFKEFCEILAKNDSQRLLNLKTIIGYLLHRNRERGEDQVVILYDEKMRDNLLANGGTGKTLLAKALSYCRETVLFDGKNVKNGSWFKNQRIDLSTELLVYDDLSKETSLEQFFNMTTTGIEVEKKRKQSFMIEYDKMPKILMSSNYYIKGPGGSSDARRRLEFEVANFFDDKKRPEDYFGNRFFGRDWDDNEWSRFYNFMMSCVKDYFQNGLMEPEGINLIKSKNLTDTTENFTEFADSYFKLNNWLDKRKMVKDYNDYFDEEITSHQFTKWVKTYSSNKNLDFQDKSSNSEYYFRLKSNQVESTK